MFYCPRNRNLNAEIIFVENEDVSGLLHPIRVFPERRQTLFVFK